MKRSEMYSKLYDLLNGCGLEGVPELSSLVLDEVEKYMLPKTVYWDTSGEYDEFDEDTADYIAECNISFDWEPEENE